MDRLLEKTKIDDKKLSRFIRTISVNELSNLSEACYYPQLKKYKFELLRFCGLKERDFKDFAKRFYKGTKWVRFKLHNDDYSNLLIFIMYYFLINNDQISFSSTMLFYNIRQYSNLIHRSIKFCNEETFKYALNNLSNIHLFKREKTIGNALYFLTKQYIKSYQNDIKYKDVDRIGKFVQESRHRINQSVKSFAETYYEAYEKKQAYRGPQEIEGEEIEIPIERGATLVDKFTKRLVVYRQYDEKAFDEAINQTKIKKTLAKDIVVELSNNKYNDHITIILKLLLNSVGDLDTLCSNRFSEHVRKLMSIKRTTKKVYFKQQIINLLQDILKSINKYNDYQRLTTRSKFLANSFLAYYLSFSFRNYLC